MGSTSVVFAVVCLIVALANATRSIRTAIFLSESENEHSNSFQFFLAQLKTRNHELSYFNQQSTDFVLSKYGDYHYDNLIILDPSLNTLGANELEIDSLVQFVEGGGNVIVGGGLRLSKMLRQFALESGIEFDKKGTIVMDHVNHIKTMNDPYHSLITSTKWIENSIVVGYPTKKIAYDGIGISIDPSNVLTFHALTGESTSYSTSPTKPINDVTDILVGLNVGLVSGVQARNNARLLFSGSTMIFNDYYTTSSHYGNGVFIEAAVAWTFGERGVLRASNIHHSREDGTSADKMLQRIERLDQPLTLYPDAEIAQDSLVYRIKDNLTYSFDVEELINGVWVPFNADDLQLEFVMLDPYIRKNLSHDSDGHYFATFTAPDMYGIFQFRVHYRRVGYSVLHWTNQVSLRPYRHDEYERFIPAAYPYYASAFSMMLGVFIFSFFFLFGSDG